MSHISTSIFEGAASISRYMAF